MMESLIDTLKNTYGLDALPVYQPKHCINENAHKDVCEQCALVCPKGIFPIGRNQKPDFSKCVKCGLCAAVCPSRAITPIGKHVKNYLMALAKTETFSVGCERDVGTWTLSVPCLAQLSWEQIAIAALRNGIVLSMRKCVSCDRDECKTAINRSLAQAELFLGAKLFREKVTILGEGDTCTPGVKLVSRREWLLMLTKPPLDTAFSYLPASFDRNSAGRLYRAILRDVVKEKYDASEKQSRPQYTMPLPKISEKCYQCGNCKHQCPEGAIDYRRNENQTQFMVTIQAWKCTGCGLCEQICREKAIDGLANMRIPHIGPLLLRQNKLYKCQDCGKILKPDTSDFLCNMCRSKRKVRERNANQQ